MTSSADPVFPLVVINATRGTRMTQLLLSESDVYADIDVVLSAGAIVDAEGRSVAIRTPRLRLELDEASGPIVCGFCFERTWTPPRFPPRCDACAAEDLCWSCRGREAVEGVQPASPLPRCNECRLADAGFVATPPQPEQTWSSRLAPVAWGLGVGALVVLALRACG